MECSGFAQERRLNQVSNKVFLHTVLLSIDCSRSPIFPCDPADVERWVRRAASLVSWRLRNWGGYKIPLGRGGGEHGRRENIFRSLTPALLIPSPLPTGILYSRQFRSHQETKMAARRTQRSTSTISRENRGLWTVYPIKGEWGQLQSWRNSTAGTYRLITGF